LNGLLLLLKFDIYLNFFADGPIGGTVIIRRIVLSVYAGIQTNVGSVLREARDFLYFTMSGVSLSST
jgi:hypothetical protein